MFSSLTVAADTVKAVVAGAEVSARFDFVFTRVEEFDDPLEPVHRGDMAEFIDGAMGEFENELPGFGLGGSIVGESRSPTSRRTFPAIIITPAKPAEPQRKQQNAQNPTHVHHRASDPGSHQTPHSALPSWNLEPAQTSPSNA